MKKCKKEYCSRTLVQLKMRSKYLIAAGKLPDGGVFTTTYFTIETLNDVSDFVLLRLVRPN